MNKQHEELRTLLGAYVLGGLDTEDRAQLESHLAGCASCREELSEYAILPGLLHPAGPPPTSPLPPAESAWDELLAAARSERSVHRRRRRRLAVAAAAAAVVAGGVLGIAVLGGPDPGGREPQGKSLVAIAGSSAHGHGRLEARAWGTEVGLHVEGLPPKERFVVWVVGRDGRREQAAVWSSTKNGSARLTGASSIPRDQVAVMRVATVRGTTLLEMRP